MNNTARVKRAERALVGAYSLEEGERGANIVDILTDLRHYCTAHGIDFANADRIAGDHYFEERRGS
jgi:hypothetical protein